MAEDIPPREELRQLRRSLTEKVLDKAASDPAWRQQLLDNSEAAMQEAGFREIQRLEEMNQSAAAQEERAEVSGQAATYPGSYYYACCGWYTRY
jgi:hypothetical protein